MLLVIVDTLRPDRLGCYGYRSIATPNIDALASGGTLFTRAVSAAPVTAPSTATILTGTYPVFHGIRDNELFSLNKSLPSIATVFRDAGYRTGAFVGSIVLDGEYGFANGFDVYDDDMSTEYIVYGESYADEKSSIQGTQRRAEHVTRSAISWLRDGYESFFCMVHYFDPHLSYDPPPEYRTQYSNSLYDGEIAYTDGQIGFLLGAIEEMGVLENTLIVLTSDHGEALGEHGEESHGYFLYDGTMLVPLIITHTNALPQGHVVRSQVRTADIMPTILDLVGLNTPATVQGESFASSLSSGGEPKSRDAYMETFHTLYSYRWHELQGVRTPEWKYIRAPQRELYDLVSNPRETENLFEREPLQANALEDTLARMESHYARARSTFAATRTELESETSKRMRTLGYVGTSIQTRRELPEPGGDYPDPKDMIKSLGARHEAKRLLRRAFIATNRGEFDAAFEMVEAAKQLSPNFASVYGTEGYVHLMKGDPKTGIRLMEKALELEPDSDNAPETLTNLGAAYVAVEDYNKAVDRLERALAMMPAKQGKAVADAQGNLGVAYLRLGDCRLAIDALSKSVELIPEQAGIFYLGVAHETCGDFAKAADTFERLLPTTTDPQQLDQIREKVRQLRSRASAGR